MRGLNSKQKRTRIRQLFAQQSGLCAGCEQPMSLTAEGDDKVTLDHIRPKSMGGTPASYNTQLMHFKCNQAKAARPPWEGTDTCG